MACSKYALPDEMTMQILKRVPVKSLLRCKSVCKSWLSITTYPEFIKDHACYQQSLTDKEPSLLMVCNAAYYSLHPLVPPDFKCYLYEPHHYTVVGSCNGIICLVYEIHCYLWNPVTKKCKEVPQFPRNQKAMVHINHAGNLAFYYDTTSNDYMVLRLLCEQETTGGLPVLQLYSTNANSWREIHVHDPSPTKVMSYPYLKLGPIINGAIYMGRMEYVISYDLHSEMCTVVQTPSSMVRYSDILDFDGSIAVIFGSTCQGSEISLWTIDDIQGKVSWTKKFTIVHDNMRWIYSCLGGGMLYGRTIEDTAVFFMYDYRKKDLKNIPLPLETRLRLRTFLKHTGTLASIGGLGHDLYDFNKEMPLM